MVWIDSTPPPIKDKENEPTSKLRLKNLTFLLLYYFYFILFAPKYHRKNILYKWRKKPPSHS